MKRHLVTLSLSLLACAAQAQQAKKQLDSLFSDISPRGLFNGNILAAKNNELFFERTEGWSNQAAGIKNNAKTRFELASLSKVFTAVAVMQLAEKHRLSLDDKAAYYLSQFPYPEITIKQLLSHTSGLPDFEIFDNDYRATPSRVMTNQDIIPALKKWGKLKLSPGQQWSYSSPGMGLLVLIVEKISGTSFQSYLTTHVYKPAGMTDTYTLHFDGRRPDVDRALPYMAPYYFSTEMVLADTMLRNQQFLHEAGGVEGPGLLVSSAPDLLKFDKALFSGKLLQPTTLNKMLSPVKLNDGSPALAQHYPGKVWFGLGWFILPDSTAGKIVFHSGFKPGTNTMLLHNQSNNATVILLDNGNSPGAPITAMNVMRILNGQKTDVIKTAVTFPYARYLLNGGADLAAIRLKQLANDTVRYTQAPRDWIAMGYEFFRTGHL